MWKIGKICDISAGTQAGELLKGRELRSHFSFLSHLPSIFAPVVNFWAESNLRFKWRKVKIKFLLSQNF